MINPLSSLMFTRASRNETLQHLTSTSNAAKHVPRIAISLSSQNGLEWKKDSAMEVDTMHSNVGSLDVIWTQHQMKGSGAVVSLIPLYTTVCTRWSCADLYSSSLMPKPGRNEDEFNIVQYSIIFLCIWPTSLLWEIVWLRKNTSTVLRCIPLLNNPDVSQTKLTIFHPSANEDWCTCLFEASAFFSYSHRVLNIHRTLPKR